MMSKDAFNWNPIMEKNIDQSIKLAIDYDFKKLHLSTDIEDFILHLSDNHSCDPKVLFLLCYPELVILVILFLCITWKLDKLNQYQFMKCSLHHLVGIRLFSNSELIITF